MIVHFVDEHREEVGVEFICRHLQVAPSTYYAARRRRAEASARARSAALLMPILRALWIANRKVYGAHNDGLDRSRSSRYGAHATMTIEVACLDPNPHELLVHDVAARTGAYERHGVDVEVVDRPGGAGLASPLTFGLGGSLLQRVRAGTPWVVASVNTDRPLFWLVARSPDVAGDLRGRRLVGWPEHVPPMLMLRAALRDAGLDTHGLEIDVVAPGPGADRQRLDAIVSGAADLALLGSQLPPRFVEDRATLVMWVGARVRIPTTGIAVNTDGRSRHDPEVLGVVRAHREALRLVIDGDDDDVVLASLAGLFADGAEADYRHFLDHFVRTSFRPIANGETRRLWERAAHELSRLAGVAAAELSDFYGEVEQA